MREFFAKRYELGLDSLMEFIIDKTGYIEYITAQYDDKSDDRQENIEELIGAMREHEQQLNDGDDALQSFLEIAALNTETDNIDESDGTVKLMTLHCAKGLEFPVVFIPGMEQDIFPSSRSKTTRLVLKKSVGCAMSVLQERWKSCICTQHANGICTAQFNGTTLQFFLKKWNLSIPRPCRCAAIHSAVLPHFSVTAVPFRML